MSSQRTMANEYASLGSVGSASAEAICSSSGAVQRMLTATVGDSDCIRLKPPILHCHLSRAEQRKTLAERRSPCMTLRECRNDMPEAMFDAQRSASNSV